MGRFAMAFAAVTAYVEVFLAASAIQKLQQEKPVEIIDRLIATISSTIDLLSSKLQGVNVEHAGDFLQSQIVREFLNAVHEIGFSGLDKIRRVLFRLDQLEV